MVSTYSLALIALCSLIYFNNEVKAECGGLIEFSNGTITSPGYPNSYPPNQDCLWEIKTAPNRKIWFHFKDIQLEMDYDFVSIKSKRGNGAIEEHGKFCNSRVNNWNITDGNILFIHFGSDRNLEYRGFSMDFYTVPFLFCELLENDKRIRSPRFPYPYPTEMECTREIHAPINHLIKLTFTHFDIEESNECAEDYVTLQSKMADGEIRRHGKFCGRKNTFTIFSESNILQILFKSTSNMGHTGFEATYTLISFLFCELLEIEKRIRSPRFPNPYPPYMECTREIYAPMNHLIKLTFTHFDIEESNECAQDYVTLQSKMADGEIRQHGKFCGRKNTFTIVSESNILQIQFKSTSNMGHTGFESTYTLTECGGLIESGNGSISSPFFPLLHASNIVCKWNFLAPNQHRVKLYFLQFDIEESNECAQDYMTLQSKMADGEIRQHGKFCGRKNTFTIFSESNILQILFNSTSNVRHTGFEATYTLFKCGGLIESGTGIISSQFLPDLYPPNSVCKWNFLVPPQHKIKLNFLQFDIEDGDDCPNDFLLVQSNSTDGIISEYGKYCGLARPSLITSKDGIIMTFVSDRSIEKRGFVVEYFIDELSDYESSISLEKSTTHDYGATTTPATTTNVDTQYNDNVTDFVTSTEGDNTFSDELSDYESSISLEKSTTPDYGATTTPATTTNVGSQYNDNVTDFVTSTEGENTFSDDSTISPTMTTATSTYAPNQPRTEDHQKAVENEEKNTNILSALALLTKRLAELEERLKLSNNNGNMPNNKSTSSKESFLEG